MPSTWPTPSPATARPPVAAKRIHPVRDAPVDPVALEGLRDDLATQLAGELLLDDLSRALYASDASLFEVTPLGVVTPRDEADVRALVRFAAEHQLPLTPRGAGTGLAGAALGPGLVVDFSRHCRTILDTGPDWVRVQPGVTCQQLAAHLARAGRRLAVEPPQGDVGTVGGLVAGDTAGVRVAKHGYPRDHVTECR